MKRYQFRGLLPIAVAGCLFAVAMGSCSNKVIEDQNVKVIELTNETENDDDESTEEVDSLLNTEDLEVPVPEEPAKGNKWTSRYGGKSERDKHDRSVEAAKMAGSEFPLTQYSLVGMEDGGVGLRNSREMKQMLTEIGFTVTTAKNKGGGTSLKAERNGTTVEAVVDTPKAHCEINFKEPKGVEDFVKSLKRSSWKKNIGMTFDYSHPVSGNNRNVFAKIDGQKVTLFCPARD
ncbi:MAG: hypothetical protein J1E63_01690 [Muribaculaceae bacterium]|nr:hypothetical protein [Muribaculaceae bacterium]